MGLYTITTRADGTVLTATIFNADHVNHVTNTEPMMVNSHEPDVATMDIETSPTIAGQPSQPTNVAGELERLRFSLTRIKQLISGGTAPAHWYVPVGGQSLVLAPTACRLERQTVAQGFPAIGPSFVVWNTTIYDTTGTMADLDLDSTLTGIIIPVTGVYIIGGYISFTSIDGDLLVTVGGRSGVLYTPLAGNEVFSNTVAMPKSVYVETIARLTAGTRVLLQVTFTSSSTAIANNDTTKPPAIWAALVGIVD